jgi:hypothetical protein
MCTGTGMFFKKAISNIPKKPLVERCVVQRGLEQKSPFFPAQYFRTLPFGLFFLLFHKECLLFRSPQTMTGLVLLNNLTPSIILSQATNHGNNIR